MPRRRLIPSVTLRGLWSLRLQNLFCDFFKIPIYRRFPPSFGNLSENTSDGRLRGNDKGETGLYRKSARSGFYRFFAFDFSCSECYYQIRIIERRLIQSDNQTNCLKGPVSPFGGPEVHRVVGSLSAVVRVTVFFFHFNLRQKDSSVRKGRE